jgi:hypothetical protein
MSEPCACQSGCDCGCCAGTEPLTPRSIANRPGLDALAYRVGTHSSFLETMQARLSSVDLPALAGLTTRQASDPAIALLDAWAVVADVLTFYQERIANEGYLRTATERRSVLELARLVGYRLRPGVASSVFLAYTIEEKPKPAAAAGSPATPATASIEEPETLIPAGSRAQSVPGPGELPQPFETSTELAARAAWNSLAVRLTRPQQPERLDTATVAPVPLYFQGIATRLAPNDALLIERGALPFALYRVLAAATDAAHDRTRAQIEPWLLDDAKKAVAPPDGAAAAIQLPEVLGSLGKPLTAQPRDSLRLPRDAATLFGPGSDLAARLLQVTRPELADGLYAAWANTPVTPPPQLQVLALRTRASVFGSNAPLELVRRETDGVIVGTKEWDLIPTVVGIRVTLSFPSGPESTPGIENAITLDGGAGGRADDVHPLVTGSFVIALLGDADPDTVTVDVLHPGAASDLLPVHLKYTFRQRRYVIEVDVAVDGKGKKIVTLTAVAGLPREGVAIQLDSPTETEILTITAGQPSEEPKVIWLDATYPQIVPGSWIALERPVPLQPVGPASRLVIASVLGVSQRSRAAYGIAARSTRIELDRDWIDPATDTFAVIRGTAVLAESVPLPLAEEPIDPIQEAICGRQIELAGLYDGLQPGRWLIFSGTRTDVGKLDKRGNVAVPVPGVAGTELAMLAGVTQGVAQPAGERTHTTLTLAAPLAYCYQRDVLRISGNVAPATHGETKAEVLGSGDSAKTLQRFTLRQPPLTWISAPTTSGISSTLAVRVNDLLWHEAESLAALGPTDRGYLTSTDDAGATSVVFGNGVRGALLPTGTANVRAVYRAGIGRPGNVKAGQISQLATRPLGVKGVVNPLAASGGADPESRDQARRNAPLAVMALDRLVSVQDYADFARTFAGIGKASAVRLADPGGRGQLVHVTIAGEDDIPILATSDLFQNLALALRRFGDPRQPVQLALRDRQLLVVSAAVKALPDFAWTAVAAAVRAALLDAFGYPRRELGQSALLAEAYAAIQAVRGVDLADVEVFDVVAGSVDTADLEEQRKRLSHGQPKQRVPAHLARAGAGDPHGSLLPAQLIYLSSEVPDTLVLQERQS